MPNVTYNLKPQGPKPWLIILFFRFNKNRFQYSTGQKIMPSAWDKKNHRAKTGATYPRAKELNQLLDNLDNTVQDNYRRYLNDNKNLSFDDLKEALKTALDKRLMKDRAEAVLPFFDFVDEMIEERERSPEYAPGTVIAYKKARNILLDFQKESRGQFTYYTFNLNWSMDFREWCFSAPRLWSTNYVNRLIRYVSSFLNEARERGLHTNEAYRSRRFNVSQEKVDHVYLNENELSELYKLELTGAEDLARDIFILGCYTGLRIGDISKLKPDNFVKLDGGDFLEVNTQKTGERVTIPVHAYVRAIIDKRNGPPEKQVQQVSNRLIKDLAARCSWGNELVLVRRSIGGKRVEQKVVKSSLVSTHTARRSFATNAFVSGVPPILIMAITGHKTERIFNQYIRIDAREKARIVSQSDFFRKLRVV